ncbi:MAG: ATP-binding protein [Pseudomonadota bacterium]
MAICYLSDEAEENGAKGASGRMIDLETFRDVFDASPQGVIVHRHQKPLYVNQAWASFHGYEIEDIMALETVLDIFSSEDRERLANYNRDRLAGLPAPLRYHYQIMHKNGALKWAEVFVQQLEWFGEHAVQCTVIDARYRDDAMAEMLRRAHQANEKFLEAINECAEGFILYDKACRLLICNRRIKQMYPELKDVLKPGVTYEDVVRARVKFGAIEDAVGQEEAWITDRVREFGQHNRQLDIQSSDGRWHQISERLLADGCILQTSIDITDRLLAERTLERHRDHLEEMVKERTAEVERQKQVVADSLDRERELSALQRQFVSMVCHEFRTPLSVIDGNAQRLLRRKDDIQTDRLATGLDKIRISVKRLTDLMETVLNAARLEAGAIEFDPKPCDPALMITDVCANYLDVNPDFRIMTDLKQLPDRFAMDVKLMRQVVSNLVSNAIKYSPQGSEIWIEGTTADDGALRLSVRDQGVGIPKAELKQLFERFFRASTSVGIAGTGIGLSMVKALVDMHDGTVSVLSEEGEGTTFIIDLPKRALEPEAAENTEAAAGDQALV